MKTIDAYELSTILDKHSKWIYSVKGGEKADLSETNLYRADLRAADLRAADLSGVDLREADLSGADLYEANLCGADLRKANLHGAFLHGANLHGANLNEADISETNFHNADLSEAIINWPLACPSYGSFIAWKKVRGMLIKLFIPEDAERCSATTNKCRCSKALVLEITDTRTGNEVESVINPRYSFLRYEKGKMAYPDSWDNNRWNECSHGIHFFMDKQTALNWR